MLRALMLIVAMMIVGLLGGFYYAYRLGASPAPPVVAAAAVEPAAARKPPAASISRVPNLRATRRALREQADAFLAALDEQGCDLDPAAHQLYTDDARYSMRYRLPDGSERDLELRGRDLKSFGMETAKELHLEGVQCSRQGRFVRVGNRRVRVVEQRLLGAQYQGRPVEIRQKRTLVIGPGADGDWAIHALTGIGVIR